MYFCHHWLPRMDWMPFVTMLKGIGYNDATSIENISDQVQSAVIPSGEQDLEETLVLAASEYMTSQTQATVEEAVKEVLHTDDGGDDKLSKMIIDIILKNCMSKVKGCIIRMQDLNVNLQVNFMALYGKQNTASLLKLFKLARRTHPYLARFQNDWATAEIVKQYLQNKRKAAQQKRKALSELNASGAHARKHRKRFDESDSHSNTSTDEEDEDEEGGNNEDDDHGNTSTDEEDKDEEDEDKDEEDEDEDEEGGNNEDDE
ncbi:hypothetical protein M405DRAFT_844068 [Rhizopogon salebrosus TDB-379]|nr:hypothetical protein M405DRAFT_844068 [Rhizopogon salebrosus TDB-379]